MPNKEPKRPLFYFLLDFGGVFDVWDVCFEVETVLKLEKFIGPS